MQSKLLTVIGALALSAAPVLAQTDSTPAPAPAPAPVVTAPAATAAPITQYVYTPKLPSVQELTNAAIAQGLTVERMVQTANQIIAFYRNASGQATTVAYQTLPPNGAPTPIVSPAPAPVVNTAPTTVVYEAAPRVVYYDSPGYYYPRYYYPPVSLSFGIGYGYRGGYYHGGYYGGHRGGHHHRGR